MGVLDYNKCDAFPNEENIKRCKFSHVIVDASNIIYKNGGCPAKNLSKPKEISSTYYIKQPGVLNAEFLETYERDPRKDKEKNDMSEDDDIETNDELEIANNHIKVRNSIILEFLELARQVADVGSIIILVWDGTLIGYPRSSFKQDKPSTPGMNYPIRRIDSVYIMYKLKQLGIPTICEDYEGEKLACVLAKQLPKSLVYSTDTDVSIFGCIKISGTSRYGPNKYISVAYPLEIPQYCRVNIAKLLGNDYSVRIYGNGFKKVCDKYTSFIDNVFNRSRFRKACLAYIAEIDENSFFTPEIISLLPMLKVAHSKDLFKKRANEIYEDVENYLSIASPLITPDMLSKFEDEIALDYRSFNKHAHDAIKNSRSKYADSIEKAQFRAADEFFTINNKDMEIAKAFIGEVDLIKKDFFFDMDEIVGESSISSKVREYNRSLSINCKNTKLETITHLICKSEYDKLCTEIAEEYKISTEEISKRIRELKDPELIREEYRNIDIPEITLKMINIHFTHAKAEENSKLELKKYTFKYELTAEELEERNLIYDFGTINKKICTKNAPYIDYKITKDVVDKVVQITIEFTSNVDDLLGTYWSPLHDIGRTNVYLIESIATDDSTNFKIIMAGDNNRYQDSVIGQI